MDQMRQHIENKDKAWLVSTLHSAGDAIMTCDSADRLDFANTEALKILGYKLPEILGKPFAEVLKIYRDGQDQAVPLWDHTSPVKLQEKTGLPRHSYYLRPDGSKSYLSAHLSPLLSETGDYLGKVVVFRDISRIIRTAVRCRYII